MNATTKLVPMRRDHVDALMPYERAMFGTEAWSRAGYLDELADHHTRSYLAAEGPDGEFLGWAGVMVLGPTAEILTVGVVPSARRRGLGRVLLRGLLRLARERGAEEVFLEVRVDNDAAIPMYFAEGFEQVGRRRGYYDGGRIDALTLRLPPAALGTQVPVTGAHPSKVWEGGAP